MTGSARQQGLAAIRAARDRGFPFYVYELADERGVFYVGKGSGGRMYGHGRPSDKTNAEKLARLQGRHVTRSVVAFFRDEAAALNHERARIAEGRAELTNIASGGTAVDEREAAKARAATLLGRLIHRDQLKPGHRRTVYDDLVAFLKREMVDPTPTSVHVARDGTLISRGYA